MSGSRGPRKAADHHWTTRGEVTAVTKIASRGDGIWAHCDDRCKLREGTRLPYVCLRVPGVLHEVFGAKGRRKAVRVEPGVQCEEHSRPGPSIQPRKGGEPVRVSSVPAHLVHPAHPVRTLRSFPLTSSLQEAVATLPESPLDLALSHPKPFHMGDYGALTHSPDPSCISDRQGWCIRKALITKRRSHCPGSATRVRSVLWLAAEPN